MAVVMLQTNLLATHNNSFIFSLWCACIQIDSSLQLSFFPLNKNQKSKFQKPWFCGFWEKLLIFAYFSTFFIGYFRNTSILTYIFNFYIILTFKSLKKILKIFFFSCHRVNFRKKDILAIFRIIFQKNWHN